MNCRLLPLGFAALLLLAACSTPNPDVAAQAPEPLVQAPVQAPLQAAMLPPPPPYAPAPRLPALTMDGYKKEVALRIVNANPEVFHDPLPKVLKSIVIVDVTIDRSGRLANAFITRSNGYKNLEKIALDNVRRAAPYPVPVGLTRRSDGSVNFMETFLFRDDGRFQVRSLAGIQ